MRRGENSQFREWNTVSGDDEEAFAHVVGYAL